MKATIEHHAHPVVTLRVGGDDFQYGDPYDYHLSLVLSDPPKLIGLDKRPTQELWKAVQSVLRELGLDGCVFVRNSEGEEQHKWLSSRDSRPHFRVIQSQNGG